MPRRRLRSNRPLARLGEGSVTGTDLIPLTLAFPIHVGKLLYRRNSQTASVRIALIKSDVTIGK